jgi:L-ascorbate metabolism protein UlaG (beta-lactamase superfamily)
MTSLTYIGHATILLEMDGVRVLTDPILRNWVWHLRRRKVKINPHWLHNIDAVLISHIHWDHLHLPSLKLLNKQTPFIVPAGLASWLKKQGFANIVEMPIGETTQVGAVSITTTYAEHSNDRLGFASSVDCVGYLINGSHTVYFPGDTDIFPGMANLVNSLDVALLPVWGWGPTLGAGHMNPYRAAEALQLLRPRLAIPIHWGTYFPFGLGWLMPHLLTSPPYAITAFAAKLAAEVKTEVISPGHSLSLAAVL